MDDVDRIRSIIIQIAEARAQLESTEPGLPAWEAEARLRVLERELDRAGVAVATATAAAGASVSGAGAGGVANGGVAGGVLAEGVLAIVS